MQQPREVVANRQHQRLILDAVSPDDHLTARERHLSQLQNDLDARERLLDAREQRLTALQASLEENKQRLTRHDQRSAQREADAEQRDEHADHRDARADDRELHATARERLLDQRDRTAHGTPDPMGQVQESFAREISRLERSDAFLQRSREAVKRAQDRLDALRHDLTAADLSDDT